MRVIEHLQELRTRVFKALLALAGGAVLGYALFPAALHLLIEPYCQALGVLQPGADCSLVALRPLEPFSVRMKSAVVIGLFIGGPVIFFQLWRFITPGLTQRERRHAIPFVVLSQVMFAAGIGFAYLIIPQGLRILLSFGGPRVETMLSATEYLSFFLTTSVAFGLVFELPLVLVFLLSVGVLEVASLRRVRPYAYVAIVAIAAVITPTTDAVTLLFMAGPMVIFYEVAIVVGVLIERARRRPATQSDIPT